MSGEASGRARPVPRVLLSAIGLAVWAAHFGAIYAANALACESGLAGRRLLGLPLVPALVAGFTLLALAALGVVLRASLARLDPPWGEGGEAEPRFTTWFAAAAAALAMQAVLLQAAPAQVLPPCG